SPVTSPTPTSPRLRAPNRPPTRAPTAASNPVPRTSPTRPTGRSGVPAPEHDPAAPGAGEVTATAGIRAPVQRVFGAFVAWERQGEWIPVTTVRVVAGDGGVGTRIEAVTTLGPAVLRDEMRVDKVDPPYEVRVIHTGRFLRGPGVMRCTPLAGGR